ncbi:MAG: hypothetical protein CSB48_11680 [Proteobacteria bacterium]|nr:MAG: hypothetical protein CSB48_11680 [Pseudomonadota bacterium]PIE40133.1 MAG: hypothetical protein CSA51_02535 [Gammaproteobacteria bacterium]
MTLSQPRFPRSPTSSPHCEFIDSQGAFDECMSLCLNSEYIAIDTEFVRTTTFYSNPGLFQIAVANRILLVDPLAVQDLSPLARVLKSNETKKIMHAMGEDIDLFKHSLKVLPENVFDTQIAAALVGIGPSIGYANLVNHLLSVELDKGETRSNWLQRPLTDRQKYYAANDVVYLVDLYHKLSSQLQQTGRKGIVEEECQRLIGVAETGSAPELYYLKMRGAWRLTRKRQVLLQRLCAWREQTAMSLNKPRARILPDAVLQLIVEKMPSDRRELSVAAHQNQQAVHQFGQEILEIINNRPLSDGGTEGRRTGATTGAGEKTEEDTLDNFLPIMPPLTPQEQALHKKLKSLVRTVARQSDFLPETLGNSKVLEEMVFKSCAASKVVVPPFYQGWRWEKIGRQLSVVMQQYLDNRQSGMSSE